MLQKAFATCKTVSAVFNFFLFESKVISAVYSMLTAVGWIVSGAKAEFVGKNKAVTPQEM